MAKRKKSKKKTGPYVPLKKKSKVDDSLVGIDFIEDADVLKDKVFKIESFFERNKKLLIGIGAGIIIIVAGILTYNYWNTNQEKNAQAAMYDAVFSFESDSLSHALQGQGGSEGLLDVADSYGSTKAGNLANLYAGIALLKEGKYNEAIERLNKFSANDDVLQARSYALIGDSYMELGDNSNAIKYYERAADYKPNKLSTPNYLMKLATAQREAGDLSAAVKTYGKVIDNYGASLDAINAKKYKSMLEAEVLGN